MNMGSYSFKLPDLGEGTVESEIVAWRAGVGEFINADQPLVDMMTDKATIEITAPGQRQAWFSGRRARRLDTGGRRAGSH